MKNVKVTQSVCLVGLWERREEGGRDCVSDGGLLEVGGYWILDG